MNVVLFDTLKFSRKLENAGFSHEQATGAAEAFSEVVNDGVATKGDIKALKADIRELRTEFKADIKELRTEFKADIKELRTELKADIKELRTELKADMREAEIRRKSDMRLVKWMFAVIIAAIVIPLIRDFLI